MEPLDMACRARGLCLYRYTLYVGAEQRAVPGLGSFQLHLRYCHVSCPSGSSPMLARWFECRDMAEGFSYVHTGVKQVMAAPMLLLILPASCSPGCGCYFKLIGSCAGAMQLLATRAAAGERSGKQQQQHRHIVQIPGLSATPLQLEAAPVQMGSRIMGGAVVAWVQHPAAWLQCQHAESTCH